MEIADYKYLSETKDYKTYKIIRHEYIGSNSLRCLYLNDDTRI